MPPLEHAQAQPLALLFSAPFAAPAAPAAAAPARNQATWRPPARPPSFLQAARAMSTPDNPLPLAKQIKFFLRACLHPWKTRAWLNRLSQPDLAPVFREQPRLALKPFHACINYKWTPAERRALLEDHYEIIPRLIAPEILARACRDGHDLLHIVNTATGRRLTLRLLCREQFSREGELALNLRDTATSLPLANIAFSVGYDKHDALRVYIGGLQAVRDPRVRDLIHDHAKELHGLRAKALLLWTLQQLAHRWGAASIYAVDDAHHPASHRNRRQKIFSSYDEFWAESEGGHMPDGFWRLPLAPRQRARDELKPNKRRQYERRYALLAALRETLHTAIARCAPANTRDDDDNNSNDNHDNTRAPVEFHHNTPAPLTPAATPTAASPADAHAHAARSRMHPAHC